jgi:ribosomal protein S18 acetylase RimI-like enzyme
MPDVSLVPMTAEEYDAWRSSAIRGYAQEHTTAGTWTAEEAPANAEGEFDALLPDGRDTTGMLLFTAKDADAAPVGILWLSLTHPRGAPDTAFVFDIEVLADRRGQGYGRAVLTAGEDEVRRRGISALGLNVFGENATAIGLYTSAGYHVTAQQMRKTL